MTLTWCHQEIFLKFLILCIYVIEVGTVFILLNISEVFWAKIIASVTIGNKFYKPGPCLCSGGTIIFGAGWWYKW